MAFLLTGIMWPEKTVPEKLYAFTLDERTFGHEKNIVDVSLVFRAGLGGGVLFAQGGQRLSGICPEVQFPLLFLPHPVAETGGYRSFLQGPRFHAVHDRKSQQPRHDVPGSEEPELLPDRLPYGNGVLWKCSEWC